MILSAIFSARSISCKDIMTVICFSFAIRRRIASSSSLCLTSRKEVGSSSTMISGSWQIARARSTRCRCPSLIALKSRLPSSFAWTAHIASSTFFSSSRERMPSLPVYGYRPVATMSWQVISSGRIRSVRTTAIFVDISLYDIRWTSCSSKLTRPPSSRSCLVILFNIVDFPEPFGPISVTISPFFTPILICSIKGLPL